MTSLPVSSTQAFFHKFDSGLRAAGTVNTLQINLGLVCNLACHHCHVESSPRRTAGDENMSTETASGVLAWIEKHPQIKTIDLTGGSPEMNPNFRNIVSHCRALGRKVMDRCNPTIISYTDPQTGQLFDWVPSFLADNQVEVVASLPCYLEDNVDQQRGRGAYNASVEGLRALNSEGYGTNPELKLNLVYNPIGPHLPPPQEVLETDYHRELEDRYGITFNHLWTITNMPIRRWRHELEREDHLEEYMQLLVDAFNPATVEGLMCRHQIHIDSSGRIHDCDFNYALRLRTPGWERRYLWNVRPADLANRRIATGDHCYACTAGCGSSCGGSLT